MNEKMKILKMLENGDITADEAAKLLSILEDKDVKKSKGTKVFESNNNNNTSSSGYSIDISNVKNKIFNVTNKITKTTSSIYKGIEKEVKNFVSNINISTNKGDLVKEFNFLLSGEDNILDFSSINGELVLKGYNGDKLTLKVVYLPKNNDANIEIYKTENKKYKLAFEKELFSKVSIEALIPRKYIKTIFLSAMNTNFSVDNVMIEELFCETENSNGILENVQGKNVNINNSNGKLIIRNVSLDSLKVLNLNHYVNFSNVDIKDLVVDVLNGKITLVNDYFNLFEDYNWKLETQNSPIMIEINTDNVNYDIDAKTSLGNINILKNNLVYMKNEPCIIIAKSQNKDKSFKNLKLNLETTNSTIVLN